MNKKSSCFKVALKKPLLYNRDVGILQEGVENINN